MTHSSELLPMLRCSPCGVNGQPLQMRSQMKLILLGDPDAVDQNVIELERRGYCDSYAWTPPLLIRENAPPIQPLPGELMRLYQRWHPATGLRLPL